jgi:hypothetical protein
MTETPEKADQTGGTPTWVKMFGIVAVVVVVLVVVLIVTGRGGPHSPRRHISPGETTPADRARGHTERLAGVTHAQP